MEKKKETRPLPTAEAIEGVLLMVEVIKVGTLDVKTPKISDEMYMEIVKAEVMR